MRNKIFFAIFTSFTLSMSLHAADAVSPKPKLSILEPANGATVPSTFKVRFGATGVDIVAAGHEQHNHDHHTEASGHFHLLTDVESLPSPDSPMPANANLIHLVQGQTETEVTLAPGKHTLQLVLGNSSHMTGASPITSKKITVIVK